VRVIRAFARFWWDFIIGDDWRIAAAVGAVLAGGALLVAFSSLTDGAITLLCGGAMMVLAGASVVVGSRAHRTRQPGCGAD
jgi:peptidoglycan/LPS O-acetylase OafA/YrhL